MKRFVLLSTLLLAACAPVPPPHWAEGGTPIPIQRARWERGDNPVDLTADGKIMVDGDELAQIDVAGRVYDDDREPVAMLEADGALLGHEGRLLGQIGTATSSPPGATAAWLAIGPDGSVTRFDQEGNRERVGVFKGCDGPMIRTCTLVAHIVTLREAADRPRVGFGVGVGVGVFR